MEHAVLGFFAPPTETAAYLLHIGAEIEHALAVQYLYAGYSLGGTGLTGEQRLLVQRWRATVLDIAREEMAHLATVQNLLTSLGSPLTLEREDYPIPTTLFPFPFELEKLTKRSLGKYVLAESPDRATLQKMGLDREIDTIWESQASPANRAAVHRVGHLYGMIRDLFSAPGDNPDPRSMVPSCDIHPESLRFQVHAGEWGLGYPDLLIKTAADRESATAAVTAIADQGEGSDLPQTGSSHFERFLEIYRAFPAEDGWQPARNVATNPTTDQTAPLERRLIHTRARVWADLFNLRYRMLLVFLSHSFCLQRPLEAVPRTPRGLVISWAFGEMYNLRSIAEILMNLPLHQDLDVRAGPPFEMPYTLALPTRVDDWWRLHRDLLHSSQGYIELLQEDGSGSEAKSYVEALAGSDRRALRQIETVIGG
jgi:Ferritin-like